MNICPRQCLTKISERIELLCFYSVNFVAAGHKYKFCYDDINFYQIIIFLPDTDTDLLQVQIKYSRIKRLKIYPEYENV